MRFLLVEGLSNEAMEVLGDYASGYIDLRVPLLLFYEVGSMLWKAMMEKLMSIEEAKEEMMKLFKLRLHIVELDEKDQHEALEFGARNALTYYDSVYAVVTKKAKLTLSTADDMLYERASKEVPAIHLRAY